MSNEGRKIQKRVLNKSTYIGNFCWTTLQYCPTPIPQIPRHSRRRQGSFLGHRHQIQRRRHLLRSSDCGSCREKTAPWEVPRSPPSRYLVPTVPQRISWWRSNGDRTPSHTGVWGRTGGWWSAAHPVVSHYHPLEHIDSSVNVK